VLIELGVVEQRHRAVLEVMEGLPVTEVAGRYGVTRQTVHRWLRWYAQGGIAALADGSHRPATCPHRMAPEVEARIVALRTEHPGWGPRTLLHYLEREGLSPLPGRSSVHRCLVRHRLIEPQKRRRKREDYRRWERLRAMELWQMDVMGGVRLAGGGELKVVTGIDDHSRFCVCAHLTPRATARPVCEAFLAAMRRHGAPEQVLTDNGKVFTARFGRGKGLVLFDRICHENDIRHLLTAPRSPTTTGKVERFHKTVRSEFLQGRVFASIEEAQAALDAWVEHYNSERPHQGIGMVAPLRRFELAAAAPEPVAPLEGVEEEAPPGLRPLTRLVSGRGTISFEAARYHVGAWLAGEAVELTLRDGLLEITHRSVLVACHARRHVPNAKTPARSASTRPRPRPVPSLASGPAVERKVDPTGYVSFAGRGYFVSNRLRGEQVEVRLAGDTVQISQRGVLLKTHVARHDRAKEHGAFSTPQGRPHRSNASRFSREEGGTQLREPMRNAGGGT
jgi:transposase InsO family protein